MTYGILFSDRALKQLKKLEINVQERIISTLERIRIRPHAHVTKLVGDPGYRLRGVNIRSLWILKMVILLS